MSRLKAAGDNPAKYQDLLSVTSPSFFFSLFHKYNLYETERVGKMWLDLKMLFCCVKSLSRFMHEILLKICITTSVNHKFETGNQFYFLSYEILLYRVLGGTYLYLNVISNSRFGLILKSTTTILTSHGVKTFLVSAILHP